MAAFKLGGLKMGGLFKALVEGAEAVHSGVSSWEGVPFGQTRPGPETRMCPPYH